LVGSTVIVGANVLREAVAEVAKLIGIHAHVI
jgi:hypothetical protein